jgi:hypothetical protein
VYFKDELLLSRTFRKINDVSPLGNLPLDNAPNIFPIGLFRVCPSVLPSPFSARGQMTNTAPARYSRMHFNLSEYQDTGFCDAANHQVTSSLCAASFDS